MQRIITIVRWAAVVSVFASAQSQAATWVRVGSSNSAVVYIDTDSLTGSPRGVIGWAKWVYVPAPNRKYAEAKVRKRYDCAARTSKLLASVNYTASGSVASSFTFAEYESSADAVVPESLGESILDGVCERVNGNSPPPG